MEKPNKFYRSSQTHVLWRKREAHWTKSQSWADTLKGQHQGATISNVSHKNALHHYMFMLLEALH